MARKDKYYGTYAMIYGYKLIKLRELGYKGTHAQFRIVCKAKSMAEANRIAESYGLDKKTFISSYTSETCNDLELKLADIYKLIICLDGTTGKRFIDAKEIL